VQVQGVNYPAIICRDMESSVQFYQRLGMTLLAVEPNRDDPESMQATLHAGGDAFVVLVGPLDKNLKLADSSIGVGSMQYLSLTISSATMDGIFNEMSNSGVRGSEEIRRGYERLVFLEDPNGVLITLTAWTADPPEGLGRAAVLARAAALREADRAPFIEDAHLRRAIEELRG